MPGTEFLREALKLHPDSRKVLLTAYADTEAAIRGINDVGLDHYLMKPWDPPAERLYPVLDDLLSDWSAQVRLPYEGIRVAGARWSPQSFAVKEFLSRNQVPYQWIDVDQDAATNELVDRVIGDERRLPVVFFPDGTRCVAPTNRELAEKVGMQTRAQLPFYDCRDRRRRAGRARGGGVRRVGGPATRCSSSRTRRAGRPARARRSRTISAFPPASPAPTSRAAPRRRRGGSARKSSTRRRRRRSAARGPVPDRDASPTAPRSPATRSCSPRAWPCARSTCRASNRSRRRRLLRRGDDRGRHVPRPGRLHRRRAATRPARARCSSRATRER